MVEKISFLYGKNKHAEKETSAREKVHFFSVFIKLRALTKGYSSLGVVWYPMFRQTRRAVMSTVIWVTTLNLNPAWNWKRYQRRSRGNVLSLFKYFVMVVNETERE